MQVSVMWTIQVSVMWTGRKNCHEKSDGTSSDLNGAENKKTCWRKVIWQNSGKSDKL